MPAAADAVRFRARLIMGELRVLRLDDTLALLRDAAAARDDRLTEAKAEEVQCRLSALRADVEEVVADLAQWR